MTVSLITGANKGIGRQIAEQLAALGHSVVVGARSPQRGEQAAAELRAGGADAIAVALEVTDPASMTAAAAVVEARHGVLDVLVNNAGWPGRPGRTSPHSAPGQPTSASCARSSRRTCSASSP